MRVFFHSLIKYFYKIFCLYMRIFAYLHIYVFCFGTINYSLLFRKSFLEYKDHDSEF